jgi:uncharacterized protein YqjF (DUF2071 family)
MIENEINPRTAIEIQINLKTVIKIPGTVPEINLRLWVENQTNANGNSE